MQTIVLVIHVLLAATLVGLVLLQQGKGADAGAAFGAGASGTVFGAQGSGNFLSKSTGILAALFFLTSLVLAGLAGHRTGPSSVVDDLPAIEAGVPTVEVPTAIEVPLDETPSDVPSLEVPLSNEVPEFESSLEVPAIPMVPLEQGDLIPEESQEEVPQATESTELETEAPTLAN